MSHEPTNCLSHIIGLSQTTCECFDTDKPIDAVTSKSGLYIDEIEGLDLNLVDSATDCETGGVWDALEKARNNATIAFKTDLMASLLGKYKQKRNPFIGNVGSPKFKNSLTINSTYAGARIYCANLISGQMTINKIGLVFAQDGMFDIEIYNNIDAEPIITYTMASIANKVSWNTLPTPLKLEMNDDTNENPQYYILYTAAGLNPKDVTGGCGCSSQIYKYYWNLERPKFQSFERDRWSEYIMLTGTQGNDISDRENWQTSSFLNGIILDTEFVCKQSELICKQNMDYESNPLALVMAYTIRFKAAALLIDTILSSSTLNRITMMEREALYGNRSTYLKSYNERIEYLRDQINWKANDCLECNNFEDVVKVGIFS
jgi:hypothetical protein